MPRRKYSFEERLKVVMHYFASEEGYRLSELNATVHGVANGAAQLTTFCSEILKPASPMKNGLQMSPNLLSMAAN